MNDVNDVIKRFMRKQRLEKLAEGLAARVSDYCDEHPQEMANAEAPTPDQVADYLRAKQIDPDDATNSPELMMKTAEAIVRNVRRNKRLLLG